MGGPTASGPPPTAGGGQGVGTTSGVSGRALSEARRAHFDLCRLHKLPRPCPTCDRVPEGEWRRRPMSHSRSPKQRAREEAARPRPVRHPSAPPAQPGGGGVEGAGDDGDQDRCGLAVRLGRLGGYIARKIARGTRHPGRVVEPARASTDRTGPEVPGGTGERGDGLRAAVRGRSAAASTGGLATPGAVNVSSGQRGADGAAASSGAVAASGDVDGSFGQRDTERISTGGASNDVEEQGSLANDGDSSIDAKGNTVHKPEAGRDGIAELPEGPVGAASLPVGNEGGEASDSQRSIAP